MFLGHHSLLQLEGVEKCALQQCPNIVSESGRPFHALAELGEALHTGPFQRVSHRHLVLQHFSTSQILRFDAREREATTG